MLYADLVDAYERISATTRRTEMTAALVKLLDETPADLVHEVVYLTQGKLYPDYEGIEVGIAERLAIRAVAEAAGTPEDQVQRAVWRTGDLGAAAEQVLRDGEMGRRGDRERWTSPRPHVSPSPRLGVGEVYSALDAIARTSGKGAIGAKVRLLTDLLGRASPVEAKYILRTVTGKLRLGLADMTILDGLAMAYGGGRKTRLDLEQAYNLCSDLGAVATAVADGGLEAVKSFHLRPGRPLRPMLAQRLRGPEEILTALGGRCQAEYKYDGERLQIHKMGDEVVLFSRRLEVATDQYPDAARLVRDHVKAREAILEAEAVAVDPESGELRPFQELMHRRRKHEIEAAMAEYPVALYAFDLLYLDGQDLTSQSFPERRDALVKVLDRSTSLQLMPGRVVGNTADLDAFFLQAIEAGCEGLVCKSIADDSTYQAGARGWGWIKWKREYMSAMNDTVDLVVVGALHGRGRRGGVYGALLLAAYDAERDSFPTVTKCGAGFSDADLAELPEKLAPYRLDHPHPRVDARMKADIWFAPALVIEVLGAEVTLSPIHTAGWGALRPNSGLAIRFPRFTGRYRTDKAPEDATTVAELRQMYKGRLRKAA